MVHNSSFVLSKLNGSTERFVELLEINHDSKWPMIIGYFRSLSLELTAFFSMLFSAVLLKVWMLSRRLKQLDPNLDALHDQSRLPTVVNSKSDLLTNHNARNRFQLMDQSP